MISIDVVSPAFADRRTRRFCARSFALALALLGAAFTARAAPPPVEAFGRVPEMANVELSPNGRRIAWTDNSGPVHRIIMFELGSEEDGQAIEVDGRMKLRSLSWADDETLLVDMSTTYTFRSNAIYRYEMFRTLAADFASGQTRMLLMEGGSRETVSGAKLIAWRTDRPKTVIMSTVDFSPTAHRPTIGTRLAGGRKDSGWVGTLFSVDTGSGRGRPLLEGTPFTHDWVVDRRGRPVARSEWQPDSRRYRVLARVGRSWREIHRQEDGEVLSLHGVTADGRAVVAIGYMGHRLTKAWRIPLDGSGPKVLVEDDEQDVENVVTDRFSGEPIGVWLGGPQQQVRWFDANSRKRHEALLRAFPGRQVELYGRSEDGKRMLARVESPSHPPIYYLVDFERKTADTVGEEYPGLADARLGELRVMSYAARDGTKIPAYLTLPPDAPAGPLPLVVLPHGGPEARDDYEFDWWSQFLASRGYAVLQPQFRGSTGFGEAHRMAGYREWGGKMQDDVTDGVRALIDQGVADPKRICIAGASYGGFAALAGVAFTPELYACAVSVNGVADLPRMLGHVARGAGEESDALAYWREHIGSPFDPKIAERSPARAAERIRAPVLLIHGVDDTVVPIGQSEAMARALAAAGKPHGLVRLPGEDHWLSRSETRLRVLKEIESFLATHLGSARG